MSEDFLSQDEVDALLRSGSDKPEEEKPEENTSGGVRNYDLATQERIVRGRMPTLEIINSRFVRNLRLGLFNFTRKTIDVTAGAIKIVKYSEFIRNLVVPTNLNMIQIKPLRGNALIVIEPDLIFLIVDNLFGGDGRHHVRVEGREFTETEQRIIRRLLNIIFEEYEKCWKPVYPVHFELVRSEMNPQFASITTPNDVVVCITFELDMGGNGGGEFHVCIPYSMIEPIRDLLHTTIQGEQMEVDKRWLGSLSKQIQSANVELIANLGQTDMTLNQILNMQVGDVIPLNIPETVTALIDNVPFMECRYGIKNGQYALKVQSMISQEID